MAYQTYITEALVCGTYDSHSADRSFLLFAREAGMVYAHAKSVREERSKQRYALQVCSHIRATLIRGKSGWKIAGVESIQNLYALSETRESRAFLRNIIRLLKRVIHGETLYEGIFDDVMFASGFIGKVPYTTLEVILSLRILHALGYIAPQPAYEQILHSTIEQALTLHASTINEKKCGEVIEHALIQSQL